MEEQEKKKLAKACFILMIVAFVLLAVAIVAVVLFFVVGVRIGNEDAQEVVPIFCVILALSFLAVVIVAGGVSHRFVDKDSDAKWEKAAYIMTFPAYIVSYLGFMIVLVFISFFQKVASGEIKTDDGVDTKSQNVYVVNDGGYERELTYFDHRCDYDDYKSPRYGKYYNRFRDDIGNYWRSYDDNKTFIKEYLGHI